MKKQKKLRVKLESYDHQLVDKATKSIVMTAKRTGADVMGPVPLPRKTRCYTVLRSPHIDKKSRDQFQITRYKRMLEVIEPTEQTMKALMELNLSAGVDVEIK